MPAIYKMDKRIAIITYIRHLASMMQKSKKHIKVMMKNRGTYAKGWQKNTSEDIRLYIHVDQQVVLLD